MTPEIPISPPVIRIAVRPSLFVIRHLSLLPALLCAFTLSIPAAENPLKINLVSEVTSIAPGKPFYAGLHLQHPRGYHTYWKFPGIVGVPTGMEWNLPPGWSAEKIEWPAPERVMMFQIKAQGFHGENLLPVKIIPPKSLSLGTTVTLQGKASWMCCGRDCNPGFKDLSLTLPVSAEEPAHDGKMKNLFAEARSLVAVPLQDWSVETSRKESSVTLRIKPQSDGARNQLARIREATFFTEDGLTDPNKGETFSKDAEGITLSIAISEHAPKPLPKKCIGIIQTPQGWLPDGGPKSLSLRVSFPQ